MSVRDWLAWLKSYKLLPTQALSDDEKKNEVAARRCFAQSVQMVTNPTSLSTNSMTMSYTDFLECLVWYAAKGNVILPTEEELKEAGHSLTQAGMIHHLKKMSEEGMIRAVGEDFELLASPFEHGAWEGDTSCSNFNQVTSSLRYKVQMFLAVLMERIELTNEMAHRLSKKKKSKK
jgi:hypothetical protein